MRLLAAVLMLASPPAEENVRRPMTVEDQFRLAEPGTPLLSRDGRFVLYTVERASLPENARHATTWLAASDGGTAPREFLREGDGNPMWAPDSRSVFFLRTVVKGEERSRELFEQPVAGGEAVQRSSVGPAPGGSWQIAPDGRSFLIVRAEEKPSGPGADTDVVYVGEGSNGEVRDFWRNLWRYDLASAAMTRVTQRDWWIWSAELSPDGTRAIVAAQPDNGVNTRWKSELYVVDLKTGDARQVTHNAVPELTPRFSPDGRSVLFSAVRLDEWEMGNGDLWLLDLATGKARNVAPGRTGRFGDAVFSPDGKTLYVQSGYGTTRFPVRIDVATGRVTALMKTEGVVRVGSWADGRRTFAYAYTDDVMPADVYVGRADVTTDRQRRITDLNPWVRDEIALGRASRVQWTSTGGVAVEGLLMLPPGARAGDEPRALMVHVACGPGCAWLNSFSARQQMWAGLGYAQLSPNVRGTSNYDDAFMQANRFDLGGGDRLDIMSGVDAMIARGIADAGRLAIDGWSYGGILGGYTITQTDRFKAASLGAMVSDWTFEYAGSYAAFERWYLGGDRWTNERHWLDRSPIVHANKVKTPTILHHGDLDDTDAPFHSAAFFAALRKFGVEARLLRYGDEGHDLRQPRHVQIRDSEDAAWMRRFVPPRP
jgi:dipeptidyl aminopeptidase/acylaminoacyl peptidase